MGRDQEEATDREAQSSVGEYSPDFIKPSCSWESVEDASSSPPRSFACLLSRFNSASRLDPPASPLNNGDGPPYELSDLMAHLPVKRGLSRFYEGKSQSFTSLASVTSVEDLAKEEYPKRTKRSRLCKSSEEDSVGGQWSPMCSHPMSEISKDSPSVVLSPFFTFSKPKISRSNFRDISYGQDGNLD